MNRKIDHINMVLNQQGNAPVGNGLDSIRLDHFPLTELSLDKIDLTTELFNRKFPVPFMISSMTGGGGEKTKSLNKNLAKLSHKFDIPLGLGSMRRVLEGDKQSFDTFEVARSYAPDAFIFANIGAQQLMGSNRSNILEMIELIDANALIVHLNPLQELIQPEGDRSFENILQEIERLLELDIPLVLKETGCGFGKRSLELIKQRFPSVVVDLAGYGGTHFGKIEACRNDISLKRELGNRFNTWGIPLKESLLTARQTLSKNQKIIASGGLKSGQDIIKCLCLGANFTAMAAPFLHHHDNGTLDQFVDTIELELKMSMLLIGVDSINKLSTDHIFSL